MFGLVAVVVVSGWHFFYSGGADATLVLATDAQLRAAEEQVQARARKLAEQIQQADENVQYRAKEELLQLRPLPVGVVPLLTECLKHPRVSTRQRAAVVLACQQPDAAKVLPALREARDAEQDEETKQLFSRAVEHLEVAGGRLPVLADSDLLTGPLQDALVKAAETDGRALSMWRMTGSGFEAGLAHEAQGSQSPTTWGGISSAWEDLPETVTLAVGASRFSATLGWNWEIAFAGEKMSLDVPPVGSLMVLKGDAMVGKSVLPAGTILVHNTHGWAPVDEKEALARVGRLLQLRQPLQEYVATDFRCVAALSAAALGTRARSLIPALARMAEDTADTGELCAYCARALACTCDRAALPVLKEMRVRAQGSPGALEAINSAIATLEQ